MSNQSTIHPYLDWVKQRLDEIDATLAAFEHNAAKLQADSGAKAEKAMADMRAARDAFGKSIKEHGEASDAVVASSKKALEAQWSAFEAAMPAFLDATGKQITEVEAAFRARADAQRKAWHETIDTLHKGASSFAANRRDEIEAAAKRMKVEADAAKATLDKLEKAGVESWAAMTSALTETRTALDKAQRTVRESLKRVV